jgi:hypothetical protein
MPWTHAGSENKITDAQGLRIRAARGRGIGCEYLLFSHVALNNNRPGKCKPERLSKESYFMN